MYVQRWNQFSCPLTITTSCESTPTITKQAKTIPYDKTEPLYLKNNNNWSAKREKEMDEELEEQTVDLTGGGSN